MPVMHAPLPLMPYGPSYMMVSPKPNSNPNLNLDSDPIPDHDQIMQRRHDRLADEGIILEVGLGLR